jgi:uncharacterized membrane-anchored protein
MGWRVCWRSAVWLFVVAYFRTAISRVLLFWLAFIPTRPLGATIGDFLDKPTNHGGLALSRPIASAVLTVVIIACILFIPQRPGVHGATALLDT